MRVLVFGDSITQGFWDEDGGWVNILRKKYDLQYMEGKDEDAPTIFNLGISGNSSDDVVARLVHETEARAKEDVAFIISIGVNDARNKSGNNFSSPEQYKENLMEILNQSRKYSDKILFVGLTPVVEEHSNPVSWDGSTGYTNARLKEFDTTLREFCEQYKVPFVEVFEPFQKEQAKTELLPDSLHPNKKGHELIASLVEPELEKLLKQS